MSWPIRSQRAKFEYQTWIKNDIYHEKNCAILNSVIRLRKPPFLLAPRRLGRFASGEERGETAVFAAYSVIGLLLNITHGP